MTGFPDYVVDAAFGPDSMTATHRRAEQPRWLAGLIAKHGEPLGGTPEPVHIGNALCQAWVWRGMGVRIERMWTTHSVTAINHGRRAKLSGLHQYPTDAEISGVVALAGLDDAPGRAS